MSSTFFISNENRLYKNLQLAKISHKINIVSKNLHRFLKSINLYGKKGKNKLFVVIKSNISKVQKLQVRHFFAGNFLLVMISKIKTNSKLSKLVQHQITKSTVT
jgi:hypothetical protein